jgi:hypothetical protein
MFSVRVTTEISLLFRRMSGLIIMRYLLEINVYRRDAIHKSVRMLHLRKYCTDFD